MRMVKNSGVSIPQYPSTMTIGKPFLGHTLILRNANTKKSNSVRLLIQPLMRMSGSNSFRNKNLPPGWRQRGSGTRNEIDYDDLPDGSYDLADDMGVIYGNGNRKDAP